MREKAITETHVPSRPPRDIGDHMQEPLGSKLNWLRAGVLGANDGIISVAGLVIGVAGATESVPVIATAGVAGVVAGALSMAGGEYVSVSSQKDAEQAALDQHRWELSNHPHEEEAELAHMYEEKGLSHDLATQVARELTEQDALRAHAEIELRIDPDDLTSPWHAAWASMVAFTLGAVLPLLAILLPPANIREWVCAAAVVVALALTGFVGAKLGGAKPLLSMVRTVVVGAVTMAVAYGIGHVLGVQVV